MLPSTAPTPHAVRIRPKPRLPAFRVLSANVRLDRPAGFEEDQRERLRRSTGREARAPALMCRHAVRRRARTESPPASSTCGRRSSSSAPHTTNDTTSTISAAGAPAAATSAPPSAGPTTKVTEKATLSAAFARRSASSTRGSSSPLARERSALEAPRGALVELGEGFRPRGVRRAPSAAARCRRARPCRRAPRARGAPGARSARAGSPRSAR